MPRSAPQPTGADRAGQPLPAPASGRAARPSGGVTAGSTWVLVAIVLLPIIVLVLVLAQRTWYPTGDLAQAELRMRSLPGRPPLLGAAGRIADKAGRQGNHPGPLMFWTTWPAYAALGRSSWAFEAATAMVNGAWLAVTVWLVARRAGLAVAVWFTAVALVLIGGFGLDALSQPWNPWVALLPFLALVVVTWSVLEGDRWMLPLGVFAGSYALQGHVGYAPLVPTLLVVAVAGLLWHERSARRERAAGVSPDAEAAEQPPTSVGRAWVAPAGVALLVGLLSWSGPLVDLLTNNPNNVGKLVAYFGGSHEAAISPSRAVEAVFQTSNPVGAWARGGTAVSGSILPGLGLLAAWAVVAVLVWRRRGPRVLTVLNALIGLMLVVGTIDVSRVFGAIYLYTFRWITDLVALVVFTLGWGAAEIVRHRSTSARPVAPLVARPARLTAAAVVVLIALSAAMAVRVSGQDFPYKSSGRLERALARQVASALRRDRRYLVDWQDPVYLGGLGFGLILALERRGYDVGAEPQFSAAVEPHRVRCPGDYDAVLTVVTGSPLIDEWRQRPNAHQLAAADSRSPAERARVGRELRELQGLLAANGKPLNLGEIEQALTPLVLDPTQPRRLAVLSADIIRAGVPSAVFLQDPAPARPPLQRNPLDEACFD